MWDSSGRLRSPGKFDGRWTDFGRYEACVDIEVAERHITATSKIANKTIDIPAFTGKYIRLFSTFTPNKNSLNEKHSSDDKMGFTQNTTASPFRPTWEWTINVDVEGEDKLSDHKDFGLDFDDLGVTNVLAQDLILVIQVKLSNIILNQLFNFSAHQNS